MKHRAAEALLASWWRAEKGGSSNASVRRDSGRAEHVSFDRLRWLEYSGLLVILAILAEAGDTGATVTALLEASDLCTDTMYSALTIALGLGLVRQEVVRRQVPVVKRYSLTESGRQLGAAAEQARAALLKVPVPPPNGLSHQVPRSAGHLTSRA